MEIPIGCSLFFIKILWSSWNKLRICTVKYKQRLEVVEKFCFINITGLEKEGGRRANYLANVRSAENKHVSYMLTYFI